MSAEQMIEEMYEDAEQRTRRVLPSRADEMIVAGAAVALALDVLRLIAFDGRVDVSTRSLALAAVAKVDATLASVNETCELGIDAMDLAIAKRDGGVQ